MLLPFGNESTFSLNLDVPVFHDEIEVGQNVRIIVISCLQVADTRSSTFNVSYDQRKITGIPELDQGRISVNSQSFQLRNQSVSAFSTPGSYHRMIPRPSATKRSVVQISFVASFYRGYEIKHNKQLT